MKTNTVNIKQTGHTGLEQRLCVPRNLQSKDQTTLYKMTGFAVSYLFYVPFTVRPKQRQHYIHRGSGNENALRGDANTARWL